MSAVADLDPRRDMGLIRERIDHALATNGDLQPTLTDLATRNPIALAELVVGPKAPPDPQWVRTVLTVIDTLEEALAAGGMATSGLYRRLVSLSPKTQELVLKTAAGRHPGASWLVALSREVEGRQAGEIHLLASATHPSFAQNCWAHAAAGHLPGLIAVAAQTGRPEAAAALTATGHLEAAGLAAVSTLRRKPESPVVAMMAAAWGPALEPVLHKTLCQLRSRAVAKALAKQVHGYPQFSVLLESIIRAMVKP